MMTAPIIIGNNQTGQQANQSAYDNSSRVIFLLNNHRRLSAAHRDV